MWEGGWRSISRRVLHLTSSRCNCCIAGSTAVLPTLPCPGFPAFPQEKGDDIKSLAVHKA